MDSRFPMEFVACVWISASEGVVKRFCEMNKKSFKKRFPMKNFLACLVLTMVLFLISGTLILDMYRNFKWAHTHDARLHELSGTIIYLDEVLTMSARMAAATGDLKWISRYDYFEPQLDNAIKEAKVIEPIIFSFAAIEITEEANNKLVEMERTSFELVLKGDLSGAFSLLASDEYEKQKKIYSEGIVRIADGLKERAVLAHARHARGGFLSVMFFVVIFVIFILIWIVFLRILRIHNIERSEFEKELHESEERYRNLFANSPVSVWEEDFSEVEKWLDKLREDGVTDLKKYFKDNPQELEYAISLIRVIDVNDASLAMFEAESKEQLISGMFDILRSETTQICLAELLAIWEGKDLVSLECSGRTFKGSPAVFLVEWTAPRVFGKLSLSNAIVVIFDITEIKKAQEKRISDIRSLAAIVAHELRNPLGVIKTAVYNIIRKNNDHALDKHLRSIEKKIAESDQIIMNLLSYSRIKLPYYGRICILDVLDECIAQCQEKYRERNVTINKKYDCPQDVVIDADSIQITEVFLNILDNAYQSFSNKKGIIDITANYEMDKNKFNITLRDNGCGIEEEVLKKIFKPFFTTKAKGVGLGLAVCERVINFHKGSLELKSEEGIGVEVYISLPIEREEDEGQ